MAPWLSIMHKAKAMLALVNCSCTATASAKGMPWPPCASGTPRPGPAAFDVELVGLGEARRQGDDAVGEFGVRLVADAVERRKDVGRQLAGFVEHRVDHIGGRIGIGRARGEAGQIGDAIEHETLFGGRARHRAWGKALGW